MGQEIKAASEILVELAYVQSVVDVLEKAHESANNALEIVKSDDTYLGDAKDEMILFYNTACNHINSLISLYTKANNFGCGAIKEMLVIDELIAKIYQILESGTKAEK